MNKEPTNEELEKAIKDLAQNLLENQIDSPPEFEKVFKKHFMELLA